MPSWETGKKYTKGNIVLYDKINYVCVQSHTSQIDWYPSIDTLSLWTVSNIPVTTPTTPTISTQPIPVTTPTISTPPIPVTTPTISTPPIPVTTPTISTPPIPVTNDKTVFAPYLYSWGYNNSVYKINKCMDVINNVQGNAVTIAFVIGNSTNDIINTFRDDFKDFKNHAGQLIISFGGANGQYIESILSIQDAVNEISKLIDTTGCKALDFDVEGSTLVDMTLNIKRATIITNLQKKYTDLYISFTLPADQNGLTDSGKQLISVSISTGVNINVVNIMAMDIGAIPVGSCWGVVASRMGDTVVAQLQQIYPSKSLQSLYRMLGITVMIGVNDDGSIFTSTDAIIIGEYAKNKNIGLISMWSINRDQVGTGPLGVYSQVNSQNYEFFNKIKNALGELGTLPNANYVIPPTPKDTWKTSAVYKVGDKVIYNGIEYMYTNTHTSSNNLKPNETPSLWISN